MDRRQGESLAARPVKSFTHEVKDKMRKILEIWSKDSTFSRNTLDRLQAKMVNSNTPPVHSPSASYLNMDPPPPIMSPALPPLDNANGQPGLTPKPNQGKYHSALFISLCWFAAGVILPIRCLRHLTLLRQRRPTWLRLDKQQGTNKSSTLIGILTC